MLSYEEFTKRVSEDIARGDSPPHRLKVEEPAFYVEWVSDGQEGGSCYGGEPHSVSPEREPGLDRLMEFLDDLDLRLRHANEILKEVTQGSYTDSGYYGNWSEYSYKYLPVSVLHEKLAGFGYVEAKPEAEAAP